MKAVVARQYGGPEVLRVEDLPDPVPKPDEVLIRVRAASVNAADWHLLRGDPWFIRLAMGWSGPKYSILGADVAGQVMAVGEKVTRLRPGDEVFGDLSDCGWGGFAELVCASETALVHKPANVSFEHAAAAPMAAVTALHALRDHAHVGADQSVLINGAGGGVGSFAVQLAKTQGARVTGVCSTGKLKLVEALGADRVIDYTVRDPTANGERYDVVIDAAASRSLLRWRRVLNPRGSYVLVGGAVTRLFQSMLLGPLMSLGGRRMGFMYSAPSTDDLSVVAELLESGKLTSPVTKCFELSEVPAAIRYVESGHPRGKVVIAVSEGHG